MKVDVESIRSAYLKTLELNKQYKELQEEMGKANEEFGLGLCHYIKELRANGMTKKQAFKEAKDEFALDEYTVRMKWEYFHGENLE